MLLLLYRRCPARGVLKLRRVRVGIVYLDVFRMARPQKHTLAYVDAEAPFVVILFFSSIPFVVFALLSLFILEVCSLPTAVRALRFFATKLQPFLPSSTRVELCQPTPRRRSL